MGDDILGEKMRLDKLLALLGEGTRSEIKAMVRAGRVTVDGAGARDAGARELCGCEAVRIDPPSHAGDRFHVRFAGGAVRHAEAVIVATGGRTARGLLPEGFEATEPRPVLGPLRTDSRLVKALNNIRVRCAISLMSPDGDAKAREEGEVLFRDYGVSGIAVFNLSRFAEAGDMLRIDTRTGEYMERV